MTLKQFIHKLEKLAEIHGDNSEVIMADNVPVVNPIFSNKYYSKKSIIITDIK